MNVVDAYADCARSRGRARLTATALRLKSVSVRDVFARLAGVATYDELVAAIRDDGVPPAVTAGEPSKSQWLRALARVMAAQNVFDDDWSNAAAIFAALPAGDLDADEQLIYGQLLYLLGDYSGARSILPSLDKLTLGAQYLDIDLKNPYVRDGQSQEAWLKALNEPFDAAGLEPVELLPDGPTPFDRLSAPVDDQRDENASVSVIMSAYKPDESLFSAVNSILNQTWRNLELIIVDDASGPGFDDRFDAVAVLDPRIRVIRQHQNQGTYVVRNVGIAAAAGQFITFQDSDDYSHPRRIELQIEPLLENPEMIGSRSMAIRATDDLTHQWLGYNAQRVNASSLMFRRDKIVDNLGYFDPVRKSADFEYAFRMEATFGRKVLDIRKPLAYTRLRMASLSRSDFTAGWASAGRIAYQSAYLHWHKQIRAGADPYLPQHPEHRAFPAPAPYLRGISQPARTEYDVVLVDDWVSHADSVDGGIEQARILAGQRLSVGIVHAESLARMSNKRRHVDPLVQDLVNAGTVDRLTLDQDVHARLVIVRDPAVLQYTQHASVMLRADKVVITAEREPTQYPGLAVAYDKTACTHNAKLLFGVDAEWSSNVDTAPVDIGRWALPRTRRRSTRPVIGQCAPDANYLFPATPASQLHVYPAFGDVDARLLAGSATIARFAKRKKAASWVFYRRDQIGLRAFLYQLDFYVCFPSSETASLPLDLIAAALASGAVLVLPERFRSQFGDAAVYCEPVDVVATVKRLYGDAAAFDEQVAAGRRYVAEHHDAGTYARQITDLLAS